MEGQKDAFWMKENWNVWGFFALQDATSTGKG
jgi:hypothetical protein